MNACADDFDLARRINAGFDRLVAQLREVGRERAMTEAQALAFASVAFLDQAAGRHETLRLIGELVDA